MKKYIILSFLLLSAFSLEAQFRFAFSNEIGVIAGPVAFQSDYGIRHNTGTNIGNTGMGIALIHYMNFAYNKACNCYSQDTYFNDHFKFREELSFTLVKNLQHYGEWVADDKNSVTAWQLRGMYGSTSVLNLGVGLEYFPLSIRDFSNGGFPFAPYISVGGNFGYYNPTAASHYGQIGTMQYTPLKYQNNAVTNDNGTVWSIMANLGVRYKLTRLSDVVLDFKWHYYYSDWVDGLNPRRDVYTENKYNDWQFWIGFGYIYYLDF
ncbi:THC0290_0291 family protein [Zhouia sp. PK063]|uniref:THC0290_0291 family protein n=1 Tax=Zhouia sp. PK063 TaxID=3373602 RepID=UPI00378FAF95